MPCEKISQEIHKCLLTNKHSGKARIEIMSRITPALRNEQQVHYRAAIRGGKKKTTEIRVLNL